MGVDDACGSGVVGVVLTRHLLALLAECSQCRCTTVEYELDGTMHASWNADVALMRSSSGSTSASSLAPQPVHCSTWQSLQHYEPDRNSVSGFHVLQLVQNKE